MTTEFDKSRRVFVSFSHADAGAAQQIAHECHRYGLQTIRVDSVVGRGAEIGPEVHRAIESSNMCVILLSPNSDFSSHVAMEWAWIQGKAWREPEYKILPVLIGGRKELPEFLRQWRAVSIPEPWDTVYDQISKNMVTGGTVVANVIVSGSTGPTGTPAKSSRSQRFAALSRAIHELAHEEAPDE